MLPLLNNPCLSWSIGTVTQHLQPQTQAARTNFSANPQPCCWFCFSGKKQRGFLNSSLLSNNLHLQFMENSWKRLSLNTRKWGQEGGRPSLLKDLLPPGAWRLPTSEQWLLCPATLLSPRSGHSPRGFAAWAMLAAKGSSVKGPILIIEKKKIKKKQFQ